MTSLTTRDVRRYRGNRRDSRRRPDVLAPPPSSAEVYASPLVQVDSMRWLYLAISRGSYLSAQGRHPKGGIATRSLGRVHASG